MNTKLVVIQGDISQLKVDAIVQASVLDECLQLPDEQGRELDQGHCQDHRQRQAEECLSKAYLTSLNRAVSQKAKTIAFPNINKAHREFSKIKAALVALTAVRNFLLEQPGLLTEVIFVCWDTENYHLYKEMLGGENRMMPVS
jgi:O-acetyl-ADP-ribose deacetylase (regulator of RNase III)